MATDPVWHRIFMFMPIMLPSIMAVFPAGLLLRWSAGLETTSRASCGEWYIMNHFRLRRSAPSLRSEFSRPDDRLYRQDVVPPGPVRAATARHEAAKIEQLRPGRG
jgi:hypothetical protein